MRLRGFEVVSAYVSSDIVLPVRKTGSSAGYDIAAAKNAIVLPGALCLVPTGLKAYMPTDEYLAVHIRSGLSVKNLLCLINGQGIIDSDYYNNPDNEGHILIALFNYGQTAVTVSKGARIAQGIFQKYLTADHEETVSTQRSGGFGSTGTI